MTNSINVGRGGAAIFVVSLLWAPMLWFAYGTTAALIGLLAATIGLVIMGAVDQEGTHG